MLQTIIQVLTSEIVLTALTTIAAAFVISKIKKDKTAKAIMPIVLEVFNVVEENAEKWGIKKHAKWLKFLEIIEDVLKENFTPEEIKVAKEQVDQLAAMNKAEVKEIIEVKGDRDYGKMINDALIKYHEQVK